MITKRHYDDGISTYEEAVFELRRRRSKFACAEDQAAVLTTLLAEATLEGRLAPWEKYWKRVPLPKTAAEPLTKPWYACRILAGIAAVRRMLTEARSQSSDRMTLEACLGTAFSLGALIEEAAWRFGVGDSVRRWSKLRASNQVNARRATVVRRETKARKDADLRTAVRAYRQEHPTHRVRTIANNLLPRFGPPGDDRRKAVDALRQRIARLTPRR